MAAYPCHVSMAIRRYPIVLLGGESNCKSKDTPKNTTHINPGHFRPEFGERHYIRENYKFYRPWPLHRGVKKKRLASRKRGSYVLFRPLSLPPYFFFLGGGG